ncbi:PTS system 2-O-a-mannosyl-D-glycerate specific transporter subunit IIABC [Escherichia coli]|uniref:PTS system 2-O-a-mannosyl-D-glycerate specific transporter subunit IIABC n=1 Tax=Escherichia coli TaxID=562 RepID=A0A2X3JMV1_ECOLX|nr:PTS system 2-O-a-mannosyl-D-glycerate specific transporter subunit IIABC [Escherichia coli]
MFTFEKQGANGIEGRLTADQLNSATACIFAAEVAIKESERFNGIPRFQCLLPSRFAMQKR